jgi:hypothetical protein
MIAKIKFDRPDGADIDDIAQFIIDAVSSWGGQFHPEDPLFHSLHVTGLTVHGRKFDVAKAYEDNEPISPAPFAKETT